VVTSRLSRISPHDLGRTLDQSVDAEVNDPKELIDDVMKDQIPKKLVNPGPSWVYLVRPNAAQCTLD
jgi:hypothetical protein